MAGVAPVGTGVDIARVVVMAGAVDMVGAAGTAAITAVIIMADMAAAIMVAVAFTAAVVTTAAAVVITAAAVVITVAVVVITGAVVVIMAAAATAADTIIKANSLN
jgi:hypothetical protein